MSENGLKRTEKAAFSIAIIILLIASFAIIQDKLIYRLFVSDRESTRPLGKITLQHKDVRRKLTDRFTWLPLEVGDQVYEGDQIFTGENSAVTIRAADGSEYLVGENSLISIGMANDQLTLNVGFGDLRLNLVPGSLIQVTQDLHTSTFTAGSNGADVVLTASNQNQFDVKVAKGKLSINDGRQAAELQPEDGVKKLKKGALPRPEDIQIDLVGTFYNRSLTPKEFNSAKKEFEWTSTYDFPAYEVLFASDEQFKNIIYKDNTTKASFWNNAILKVQRDAKIYWKVRAQIPGVEKPVQSEHAYFLFSSDKAPLLIFPTADLRLGVEDLSSSGLQVYFAFAPQTPLNYYEVEISRTQKFDQATKVLMVRKSPASSDELSPGIYYWRVKGQAGSNQNGRILTSQINRFFIESHQSNKVRAPKILKKEAWFELASRTEGLRHSEVKSMPIPEQLSLADNFPVLKVDDEGDLRAHQFQLSTTPDFAETLFSATSTSNEVIWRAPRLGKFYYRARTMDGALYSQYSAPSSLGVKVFPPITTTPTEISQKIEDIAESAKAVDPVKISWLPTIFTDKYEVVVSADSDFRQTLLRGIVDQDNYPLNLAGPGTYYWKIRSLNKLGDPISNFSNVNYFRFTKEFTNKQEIRAFRQLFPEQNDTLFVLGTGRNTVRFRWTSPFPKETKFQMMLASEEEYKNPILNLSTKSSYVDYKKTLPAGWYYWRVRAKMGDVITEWTPTAKFQIVLQKRFNVAGMRTLGRLKEINSEGAAQPEDRSIASTTLKPSNKISAPKIMDADKPKVALISADSLDKVSWKDLFAVTKESVGAVKNWPFLTWGKVEQADNYVLEVSTKKDFSSLVLRKDLNANEYSWTNSPIGNYFYRVIATRLSVGSSQPSEAQRLKILYAPPVIINPVQRVEWKNSVNRDKPPAPFDITWTPVPFAENYQLDLARDLNFSDAKTMFASENKFRIRLSNAGQHYVRIRGLDQYNQAISPFTTPYPIDFQILDQIPLVANDLILTFPLTNSEVLVPNQELHHVGFKWINGFNRADFTVQLSRTSSFQSVLYEEKSDRAELVIRRKMDPGLHYWRVGVALPNGQTHWSKANSFTIKILNWNAPGDSANRSLSSVKN